MAEPGRRSPRKSLSFQVNSHGIHIGYRNGAAIPPAGAGSALTAKESNLMFKLAITTALAVGLGVAGVSNGYAAAAAPAAGMRAALAPLETVELAQFVDKRVRVGPRGGVAARTTVVGPRGGVATRTTVVRPGGTVIRGGVVGPARVVGPGRVVGPSRVYGYSRPVYVRTYRPIVRRPWFGLAVAGVTLGAIATVATAGIVPPAPGPGLCWYWADPYEETGYWGYC
jgi:hypothetical protein